jgi:hypothetical protein
MGEAKRKAIVKGHALHVLRPRISARRIAVAFPWANPKHPPIRIGLFPYTIQPA